jgi:hypothetical protein
MPRIIYSISGGACLRRFRMRARPFRISRPTTSEDVRRLPRPSGLSRSSRRPHS